MCYLEVAEYNKSKYLKKVQSVPSARRGFYHYAYGVDTSSSACVAAYITDCINQHIKSNNPSSKGSKSKDKKSKEDDDSKGSKKANEIIEKVLKGTFCIYDIVTKRDIRVEIQIPGGTQVYALDQFSDHHHEILGILEWNNVFMSSVLRSLEAPILPCPIMRVIRELPSPQSFNDFL